MNKVEVKPYSRGDKEIDFVINDVSFTLDFDDVDHIKAEAMLKALIGRLKISPSLTESIIYKSSVKESLIDEWNHEWFDEDDKMEYDNDIDNYLKIEMEKRGLKYEN